MEKKKQPSTFEANSLQHSNEHNGCFKLLWSRSVLCCDGWFAISGISFWVLQVLINGITEKAGIKENLSEVRHEHKMLTLVISRCFIWLIQNYWVLDWCCSDTAILLTWAEPFLVSFVSAAGNSFLNLSQLKQLTGKRLSGNKVIWEEHPAPKYSKEPVQTWGWYGGPNGEWKQKDHKRR